ncbi:MAG: acyl-CoA dehydrogenase family protein [Myxococcales bacterium]|nr:acyl-CoA dehydrogenase family protein [Myxococcales bacterium]
MHVDYTPEQKALRREVREYYARLITPELRAQLRPMESGPVQRRIIRQIGADGWLGVGWPREYGGRGRTAIEQQIWFEETRRAGAPLPFVTLNTVGPALIAMGSEAQKRRFLPGILAGEIHFAIGYTEPEAGTDLASLRTRAVRDGDHYVVDGTKIFTSGASDADYIWLACRTDPDAPPHAGLSILIVDTRLPGFSWAPIHTVGGGTTAMTYYEKVRVPADMLVGPENGGWRLITLQLNHERIGLAAFGSAALKTFDEVVQWARDTGDESGSAVVEKPWVQTALAEAFARLEALKVMNWQLAWELERERLDPARASAAKVYGSETLIEVYRLLLEVLGIVGTVRADSPGAVLRGQIEQEWRASQINTFGGGVNEILREIVATLGLGLPRGRRR